jgi:hypothetical protein
VESRHGGVGWFHNPQNSSTTTLENTSADSLLAGVVKLYSSIISFVAEKHARRTTNLLCDNTLATRAMGFCPACTAALPPHLVASTAVQA